MKRVLFTLSIASLSCLAASPAFAQKPGAKGSKPPATAPAHPAPKAQTPTSKDPQKPTDATSKPAAHTAKAPAVGEEVDASIAMTDINGKAHALHDMRGKTVVLSFWSMDSGAATAYDKRLADLASTFAQKGVTFLVVDPSAVDVDEHDAEPFKRLQNHAMKIGWTLPIAIDKGGAIAQRLGVDTVPQVLVLDGKGTLRYSGAIDDDADGKKADKATHYLHDALQALVDGKEIATKVTKPVGTAIPHAAVARPTEAGAKGGAAH